MSHDATGADAGPEREPAGDPGAAVPARDPFAARPARDPGGAVPARDPFAARPARDPGGVPPAPEPARQSADTAEHRPADASARLPTHDPQHGPIHDPARIERLDRALLRMRRAVVRPETTDVPIPALQRPVDLAKVLACLAVSDLHQIEDPQRPVTVKEVALALSLEHSTASRLLAEAEAEGLVSRATDPVDRRRTIVHLTDDGDAVVAQSSAIRTWTIDLLLADWSPEELGTFTELVEKFTTTIGERAEAAISAAQQHFRSPA